MGATPWRFKSSHPHSQIKRFRGPLVAQTLKMSVWPAIAASGITGATAVIGYFFGDRSSRRSTDATVKQIESENERVVQQITAENERLRAQSRENHLAQSAVDLPQVHDGGSHDETRCLRTGRSL